MWSTSHYLDSAWEQWYQLKHRDAYMNESGDSFEKYITNVLEMVYPDFINPDPMGQRGDGGCDGLSNQEELFIACYGQRAQANQDTKAKEKIKSDFNRAIQGEFNS